MASDPSGLEEQNALALAIVHTEDNSSNVKTQNIKEQSFSSTGWEVALVDTSNSTSNVQVESKMGGGLDKLTLNSLYEDATTRQTNYSGAYHMGQMTPNPFEALPVLQPGQDPFYASNNVAPPASVQMASMAQQQAYMAQQQMTGSQVGANPFGNPYAGAPLPYTNGAQSQAQYQYGHAAPFM
eukprot:TRINITY_DN1645_c1_g1_i3.p1 TRINITY_DN1645_c1_g1~~TRINITY_DN1645_c1_g1_i3.p1  ORF type:complete len:183 (+),score=48.87 TRINITY_DN1645_c1_g1_i3:817-1365(+)